MLRPANAADVKIKVNNFMIILTTEIRCRSKFLFVAGESSGRSDAVTCDDSARATNELVSHKRAGVVFPIYENYAVDRAGSDARSELAHDRFYWSCIGKNAG